MKKTAIQKVLNKIGSLLLLMLPLTAAYFLIELLSAAILLPEGFSGLAFGGFWALFLAGICLSLPRRVGRVFFGISYYFFLLWTLAQTGYCKIFNRMMWMSDIFYAGEGADYITDVLSAFPAVWWVGGLLLMGLGVLLIVRFPKTEFGVLNKYPYFAVTAVALAGLLVLPEIVFLRDLNVWGTRSEYAQSSSYRATYQTMYDARNVYEICGVYQLTFRDVWKHEVYPLTPAYRAEQEEQIGKIDAYFDTRGPHDENVMTGLYKGKNVVLVLMESMDDWMITHEDTPTISRMMAEGINFTQFYTPGYGTARTINSEFCVNTGIYLPTNGRYVFDYVTNEFNQSIAAQAVDNGYSAEVFHYNTPEFYSRGVFEPAMGYGAYRCYGDYTSDSQALYDECLLFEISELKDLFFRDGQTFNTIITRSAHLSYVYNEVLSHYALKCYPEYRGKYGSQEEDCARVKARLVDDLFARLLAELDEAGQLENTVIIGVTDHYTYGYKNTDELFAHSGVNSTLLLEKTPCFLWTPGGPSLEVGKTLNTADFLPTVLNLLGFDSPYRYLGQDAFDPDYEGYALFPDGSWISDGIACRQTVGKEPEIIMNLENKQISDDYCREMSEKVKTFMEISNLLLASDYYKLDQ